MPEPQQAHPLPPQATHKRPHQHHNNRRGPRRQQQQQHGRKRRRGPPPLSREVPPPPPAGCSICNKEDEPPKYKCPKCWALYCSMVCCKEHKNVCPGAQLASDPPSSKSRAWGSLPLPLPQFRGRRQRDNNDDEDSLDDGWKLTQDMKTAVERSEWLRRQLQDGGLRTLIRQVVDSGGNPDALRLVQERFSQFQAFIDKLLVVAGVLGREQDPKNEEEEEEPLDEWLERDWSQDPAPHQLSLKPWRRKMPVFQPVDASSSSSEEEEDSADEDSSSNSSEGESEEAEEDAESGDSS